ncbi:hypothetical protein Tco_0705720 [Tanacetum coccineum]|uniref:Uncharacterized protein n=1 Tax=Tanacetum coccineum TaxID=301880 RepID=A0ABQ4Y5D9_9ASTR
MWSFCPLAALTVQLEPLILLRVLILLELKVLLIVKTTVENLRGMLARVEKLLLIGLSVSVSAGFGYDPGVTQAEEGPKTKFCSLMAVFFNKFKFILHTLSVVCQLKEPTVDDICEHKMLERSGTPQLLRDWGV